jgi:hypothetical protein
MGDMKGLKIQIPEQLKEDVPHTTWGKILTATPVVMAVVSTMLAGLASSEMTRAQYDRALAAQQQSKAGDQWSFFQAKRLRGAVQRNTSDLLQTMAQVRPLETAALRTWAGQLPSGLAPVKERVLQVLDSTSGQQTIQYLQKGELPPIGAEPVKDSNLKAALTCLEELGTDAEMARVLAPISAKQLEDAVRTARDYAQSFDAATKPVNQGIDTLEGALSNLSAQDNTATGPSVSRDFMAARLRFAAQRYEVEGRLNQSIANLYELLVRKSNISAERHHVRSQRFFFGMLGAQLGVIISTFAMAARKRNLLWSLAAGAGVLAVGFAIYVYLCI